MYEITITFTEIDKNGNDRNKKENLILENAESFADAEQIGYDYGSGLTAIDVVSIKRSKLKEIVNERPFNDDTSRFTLHRLLTTLLTWKRKKQKTSSIP